ncbi:hypothetical protein M8818_001094 [Zalaria obscura]|uniref:Uncharacterized protein n=1 Tax=Zalaria obscura TaxID=2024903 RepID=A0ACC3SM45_9PEZI
MIVDIRRQTAQHATEPIPVTWPGVGGERWHGGSVWLSRALQIYALKKYLGNTRKQLTTFSRSITVSSTALCPGNVQMTGLCAPLVNRWVTWTGESERLGKRVHRESQPSMFRTALPRQSHTINVDNPGCLKTSINLKKSLATPTFAAPEPHSMVSHGNPDLSVCVAGVKAGWGSELNPKQIFGLPKSRGPCQKGKLPTSRLVPGASSHT